MFVRVLLLGLLLGLAQPGSSRADIILGSSGRGVVLPPPPSPPLPPPPPGGEPVQEADPGEPGGGNVPFTLPFSAANVIPDPVRPYAYASDYEGKTLAVLNLTNGLIERQFQFDWNPETIVVSPDGHKMYVALLTRPHEYCWWIETGQTGHIAEFNLDSLTKTRTYHIQQDPYDLAVTDAGILLVAGGWNQKLYLRSYRAATGELLGSSELFEQSRVVLHPNQQMAYTAKNDSAWSTHLRHFDFDPLTGVFGADWDSAERGSFNVEAIFFCHPNGTNILAHSGQVYSSAATKTQDLLYLRTLAGGRFEGAAFDLGRSALLAVGNSTLRHYQASSLELVSSQPLTNAATFVQVLGEQVVVGWTEFNRTRFQCLANPAAGAETNQAPVAAFAHTPVNATTRTPVRLDGNLSTDDQGGGRALQYRWDWNNDGVFDTPFTNQPVATHHFNVAGTKTVALQVQDRYGATALAAETFEVIDEADPGEPGGGNPPFVLPFVATKVAFDPVRPYAYASDYNNKRLVMLNLTNGVMQRQYFFDWSPEAIAITPDGQRMYVGLVLQPHDAFYRDPTKRGGYIAEFDLNSLTKTREFEINEDPYDLAVTEAGILLVTGGANDSPRLGSYRAATGQPLGSRPIYPRYRLALHPSQQSVYLFDVFDTMDAVQHVGFDPVTGAFTSGWTPVDTTYYAINRLIVCHPNGTNVLTGTGGIFSSALTADQDLRHLGSFSGEFIAAAFDTGHRALFTADGYQVRYYDLATFELAGSWALTNYSSPRYLHALGDQVFVGWANATSTRFQSYPNPAVGGETNQAPVAAFERTPNPATTASTLRFDGGLSTDDQGGGANLLYRWDWENDGVFDTPFTNQPVALHHYTLAGTKTVVLEVKDRYGAVSFARQSFELPWADDPGTPPAPGEGNAPYELPFVAASVAFDPVRPYLYASDYSNQTLVTLNLTNGLIERQYRFEWNPEKIAITPDGQKMYVAVLTRPHSPWWPEEDRMGYIAEFDLSTQTRTREFQIKEDPYDLAVTDAGLLFVTSGSGQWSYLRSYRAATGELLSTRGNIHERSRLALHPGQQALYLIDVGLYSTALRRYGFDPVSGAFASDWAASHLPHGPGLWTVLCHPHGAAVLAGGSAGDVLSSAATSDQDLLYRQTLDGGAVKAAVFDPGHKALFTAGDFRLRYYHWESYELLWSHPLTNDARYVQATTNQVIVGWTEPGRTRFQCFPNPAIGAETNQAPVAAFARTPANATAVTAIRFDGSLSCDPEDGAGLQYRWDWDNDGWYDTPFSPEPVATHRYRRGGAQTVRLQVKDRKGELGLTVQSFEVAQADDPGEPGGEHAPFVLPFAAADVAFDPARPYAYASSGADQLLAMVNLTNGLVERQFRFDQYPQSIAITPNGQKMYVVLRQRLDASPSWSLDGRIGYIAEFDLRSQNKTREFQIEGDPYALVATDAGLLIAPTIGNDWTHLRTYRATTGELLCSREVYPIERLGLHPGQRALYGANTDDWSYLALRRFDFAPDTGEILSSWNWHYYNQYPVRGKVFCHPTGTSVVAGGGWVFSSASTEDQDLLYQRTLAGGPIDAVAFDTRNNALFTVGAGDGVPRLCQYQLDSCRLLSSRVLSNDTRFVHVLGRDLYLAGTNTAQTWFQRLRNPALLVPVITQHPISQRVAAGSRVSLRAAARGGAPLFYQWFLDGKPLPGETAPSLMLPRVQAAQTGAYYVTVANTSGVVTSRVAQVSLMKPFQLTRRAPLPPSLANLPALSLFTLQRFYAATLQSIGGRSAAPYSGHLEGISSTISYDRLNEWIFQDMVPSTNQVAVVSNGLPALDLTLLGPGQLQIGVNGVPGQTVVLQASSDLSGWKPVATNTLTSSRWVSTRELSGGATNQFYRAIALP